MLYDYMATSRKPKYMKVFGSVMNDMMGWFIANKPEMANDYVERLCAIKWKNYLTTGEAEQIVSKMVPKAPWSRDVWRSNIVSLGLEEEEEPYYNSCALWVAMNMVYSDSAHSIAKIMGMTLGEVSDEDMINAVHALALDKLKDVDGVFDIRAYFGL